MLSLSKKISTINLFFFTICYINKSSFIVQPSNIFRCERCCHRDWCHHRAGHCTCRQPSPGRPWKLILDRLVWSEGSVQDWLSASTNKFWTGLAVGTNWFQISWPLIVQGQLENQSAAMDNRFQTGLAVSACQFQTELALSTRYIQDWPVGVNKPVQISESPAITNLNFVGWWWAYSTWLWWPLPSRPTVNKISK